VGALHPRGVDRAHHTFENWADRFCEPESEEKLIAIVKDAAARGGRVRAQGGSHTDSASLNGVWMSG